MDYLPFSQVYMLWVSIMAGMLLGFIWDLYRLIRHYCKLNTAFTAIGDIIYWIISIKISIQLILDISYGNIRFFILWGFIAGALLYFYGSSKYILSLLIFIIDFLIKVVKACLNILVAPGRYIIKKLKIFLLPLKLKYIAIIHKLKKRYKFLKFKLKKVSKNRKMLYNKKKRKRKEQSKLERRAKDYRTKEKN